MLRAGTRTLSKLSAAGPPSPMVWMKLDVQPIARSTRNAVVPPPRTPFSLSVTATTMTKSASFPLVMNVFSPLSTQSTPSWRADSLMFAASDPAPGSVMAKQEMRSPSIVGIRNSLRCSSLAKYRMLSASPPNRNGTKVCPISVKMSDCMTAGRFIPPYSSGGQSPEAELLGLELELGAARRGDAGLTPALPAQHLRPRGPRPPLRMKVRAVSRIARSSSLSEKSTVVSDDVAMVRRRRSHQ
jgi:hypothetical protein